VTAPVGPTAAATSARSYKNRPARVSDDRPTEYIPQPERMRNPYLPATAFVDPEGSNRREIRDLLITVLDLLLGHLATASQRPVSPPLEEYPGFETVPDEPLPLPSIIERISFLIRQPRNLAHPGYLGNMESMPATMSIIAALIIATTKNNMLGQEMAPFLSAVEPRVLRWIAARFGLGAEAGGGMLAGGTLANLQALTTARNAKLQCHEHGISDRARAPVLFASEVAHTSLQKAAMVMGLGRAAVIAVRADENSRMDAEDLRRKVRASIAGGKQQPFCVVATAGTTITGNIDPLGDVASIAREYDLWLHTDAIYGGALVFSSQYRTRLRGIEHSDSITLNLHKWLYSGLTSSIVLFRNLAHLEEHFRIAAPYMGSDPRTANLGEYSLQGSRQADIVSLLFTLQHLGRKTLGNLIDDRICLAETLRSLLLESGVARLSGAMDTNILCFRPIAAPADRSLVELQTRLANEAAVCLTAPVYRGETWLKAVLLNPFTVTEDLGRLVKAFSSHPPS
jgi:glutamate/tyrosine decarboxylase-like PLP-dependent enzyme